MPESTSPAPCAGLVVLVTGHSGGIGGFVFDLLRGDRERISCVAGLSRRANPRHDDEHSLHLRGDVANWRDCAEAVQRVIQRSGRLDVLINNAAIRPYVPLLAPRPAAWVEVFSINAIGAYACTTQALPHLLRSPSGGTVVNLVSGEASRPQPGMSAYAASKAALASLTQAMARELAHTGLRAYDCLPGDVRTSMNPAGTCSAEDAAARVVALAIERALPSGACLWPDGSWTPAGSNTLRASTHVGANEGALTPC